jgi:DNA polymerase III alpha subunit
MAFGTIEDLRGKMEVIFFPETYQKFQSLLSQSMMEVEPILVTGEIDAGAEAVKLLANKVEWLKEAHQSRSQKFVVKILSDRASRDQLRALKQQCLEMRGDCQVRLEFEGPGFRTRMELPEELKLPSTPECVSRLRKIFGENAIRLV